MLSEDCGSCVLSLFLYLSFLCLDFVSLILDVMLFFLLALCMRYSRIEMNVHAFTGLKGTAELLNY